MNSELKKGKGEVKALEGGTGPWAPGKCPHLRVVKTSSYLTFQVSYNLPKGCSQTSLLISHWQKRIPSGSTSMTGILGVQRGEVSFSDLSESRVVGEQGFPGSRLCHSHLSDPY